MTAEIVDAQNKTSMCSKTCSNCVLKTLTVFNVCTYRNNQ